MKINFIDDFCVNCENCADACPLHLITILDMPENDSRFKYDKTKCIQCGKCIKACPTDALVEC